MKIQHHAVASTILMGITFAAFRSWGLSLAVLFSGILIDLDHLLDYFIRHGHDFTIRKFFQASYERQYRRAVLILHGWEWIILCCLVVLWIGWISWLVGLIIGVSSHLILDQMGNRPNLLGYSLFWRCRNRFDFDTVFPPRTWPHGEVTEDGVRANPELG